MTRVAHCSFCDDVRAEIGNKLSIMGVYSGELITPSTPFVLSKLCCILSCITPIERPFSSLAFRLSVDGNEIARGEIPPDQLAAMWKNIQPRIDGPDPITRFSTSMTLVLSPYMIASSHVIKAFAIPDGEEILAGRLYVSPSPRARPD